MNRSYAARSAAPSYHDGRKFCKKPRRTGRTCPIRGGTAGADRHNRDRRGAEVTGSYPHGHMAPVHAQARALGLSDCSGRQTGTAT